MKSRKVKKIGVTLINAIKVLRNQAEDKEQKGLLSLFSSYIKDVFNTTENLSELISTISNLAENMKSSDNKLDRYERFILYSMLNCTLENLNTIYVEYNQMKNESSKCFSKSRIKNAICSVLKSCFKEKDYEDFVLDDVVLMDNIASLPMFLEILKKDKNKLLNNFIDFSDKYVYGIIHNGISNKDLKMNRPVLPKSSSYKYAFMHTSRGVVGIEWSDMYYNSYYLFRITRSSVEAANDIYVSKECNEFGPKYPYENQTALLNNYKPLKIAEIYMRAIENELPSFAHVKSTVLGLKVDKLYI